MGQTFKVASIVPLKQTQGKDPADANKVIKLNRWRVSSLNAGEKHSQAEDMLDMPEWCILALPESVKECPVKAGNFVECVLRQPTAADDKTITTNFYYKRHWGTLEEMMNFIKAAAKANAQGDLQHQIRVLKAEQLRDAQGGTVRQLSRMPSDLTSGM